MTGLEKLVEWLDSKAGASVLVKDYWLEAADKARALLAEEAEQKPVEESVEGLCGTCNGSGMVQIGPNIRGMKTCETCKGKGKIAGHRPVEDEPLEELAAKKGIGYEIYCHLGKYHIQMFGSELCTQEIFKAFKDIELGAIKSLARAYLNGLDDKSDSK